MADSRIIAVSENCLQVQFEQKICLKNNQKIGNFIILFNKLAIDVLRNYEIVPTYCSVSIFFDLAETSFSAVKFFTAYVLKKIEQADINESFSSKIINVPVCYENEDFSPDLENVSSYTGLSKEEIIKIHSSEDYLIYMMGFLPGFPYLGGMDERLEVPRLETPRTRIPAGSVAIGGKQTGIYPVDSPGGWQIIGRTPLRLFDAERNPSFLYEPGDKIRFVPITRQEYDSFKEEIWLKKNFSRVIKTNNSSNKLKERSVCGSGLKILDGGILTTVQDSGVFGFQKYGIGQSGVMDMESYLLANRICGNEEKTACLETTLKGPDIRFICPCDFVITGAVFENATLNGNPITMNKKIHADKDSILSCGYASKGLRSYIAFSGGILVPKIFGSSSTNLKSKLGGYYGRCLANGDEIALGMQELPVIYPEELKIQNSFFNQFEEVLTIECLKSSQYDFFSMNSVKTFTEAIYTVSAQSDRMGIRFEGESLNCGNTDIISDAIPFGAVQITSAGFPVVMAADRQTTGGYAKIACVTRNSMCKLAQAIPGTKVKFKILNEEEVHNEK